MFALVMTTEFQVIFVLSVLLIGLIAKDIVQFLFRKDDRDEQLRRDAGQAKAIFAHYKWLHSEKLADCINVKDRTGLWAEIKILFRAFRDRAEGTKIICDATVGALGTILSEGGEYAEKAIKIVQSHLATRGPAPPDPTSKAP